MTTAHEGSRKLMSELESVLGAVEDFLQTAGSETGERLDDARDRLAEMTRRARAGLKSAGAGAREAVDSTERTIRDHPWSAVSISAAVGLLIGVLIARR